MSSRAWCLTINSYTDSDIADCILAVDDARYSIFGFERGSKKSRHHIQGYIYFEQAKSLRRMKKYFPRAHLEIAKGNGIQNQEYCSKEGNAVEFGECPHQGQIDRDKLEEIMSNPYSNFHLYNQYRRSYTELKRHEKKDHERKLMLCDFSDIPGLISDDSSYLVVYPEESYGDPLSLYTDEKIVFFPYDVSLNIRLVHWSTGIIPKIRRGYEVIPFDPEIVYLVSYNKDEHKCLAERYKKFLTIG